MYSVNDFRYYSELWHHGIKNQKWGVRNGPPYPLNQETHRQVVKGFGSTKSKSQQNGSARELREKFLNYRSRQMKKMANEVYKEWFNEPMYIVRDGNRYLASNAISSLTKVSKEADKRVKKDPKYKELRKEYKRALAAEENKFGQIDTSNPPAKERVASATFIGSDLPVKMKPMSRVQDAKATNPNFKSKNSSGFTQNCVNCTAAYEMRRRGYDVKAGPTKGLESIDYLTSMFNSPSEEHVTPTKGIKDPYERAKHSYEKIEKKILKQGEGARGNLMVSWDEWSGHAVSYEVKNGKVILVDSQCGKVYNNPFDDLVQYGDGELYSIRLDNVDFNPKEIKKAVRA